MNWYEKLLPKRSHYFLSALFLFLGKIMWQLFCFAKKIPPLEKKELNINQGISVFDRTPHMNFQEKSMENLCWNSQRNTWSSHWVSGDISEEIQVLFLRNFSRNSWKNFLICFWRCLQMNAYGIYKQISGWILLKLRSEILETILGGIAEGIWGKFLKKTKRRFFENIHFPWQSPFHFFRKKKSWRYLERNSWRLPKS